MLPVPGDRDRWWRDAGGGEVPAILEIKTGRAHNENFLIFYLQPKKKGLNITKAKLNFDILSLLPRR